MIVGGGLGWSASEILQVRFDSKRLQRRRSPLGDRQLPSWLLGPARLLDRTNGNPLFGPTQSADVDDHRCSKTADCEPASPNDYPGQCPALWGRCWRRRKI